MTQTNYQEVSLYGEMIESFVVEELDPLQILINEEDEQGLNDPELPIPQTHQHHKIFQLPRGTVKLMSNIGKTKLIIEQADEIVDHRGRILYTPRIYTSLAWAGAVRVVGGERFIYDLGKQLAELCEDNDDPEDKDFVARKTQIEDLIASQEKTIAEASELYAWAYPHSIKNYAKPKDVVKFLEEVQNIEAEQVADMRGMQRRIDEGRMTKKQAKKIVAELQADAKERAEEQARWFRSNEQELINKLEACIRIKPSMDFDISDQLYMKILDKLSDKIDTYILENEKTMFARTTTRRRRNNAESNDSLLEALLNKVDEMYVDIARAMENGAAPVEEGGVY